MSEEEVIRTWVEGRLIRDPLMEILLAKLGASMREGVHYHVVAEPPKITMTPYKENEMNELTDFDEALTLLKDVKNGLLGECSFCFCPLDSNDPNRHRHGPNCRLAAFLKKWEGK